MYYWIDIIESTNNFQNSRINHQIQVNEQTLNATEDTVNECDLRVQVVEKCNICFESPPSIINNTFIKLSCKHFFHKDCLKIHISKNGNICSMCRTDINDQDWDSELNEEIINDEIINDEIWIINPLTKRKIKWGGKTHKQLIEDGYDI
jgi:hypothetical protein